MTMKRRILAVTSAALSLLASAVVFTAWSAPARAVGEVVEVHYKVNHIVNFDIPTGGIIGCHDFGVGDPSTTSWCTLRQALTLANEVDASTPVKITVDWKTLQGANSQGPPWNILLPADPRDVNATPMCQSGCDDAGDGTRAFYKITKDNLTLDLGGLGDERGLGILATNEGLEHSTIWIGSGHVTVRNVPGLYSSKSAIVIADTAHNVTIDNGATDQSGTDAHHDYAYAPNFTERFVSIMGRAHGTR